MHVCTPAATAACSRALPRNKHNFYFCWMVDHVQRGDRKGQESRCKEGKKKPSKRPRLIWGSLRTIQHNGWRDSSSRCKTTDSGITLVESPKSQNQKKKEKKMLHLLWIGQRTEKRPFHSQCIFVVRLWRLKDSMGGLQRTLRTVSWLFQTMLVNQGWGNQSQGGQQGFPLSCWVVAPTETGYSPPVYTTGEAKIEKP